MKQLLLALAAGGFALTSGQAQANSAREYFVARISQNAALSELSRGDRDYYSQLFAAIDRADWGEVEELFDRRGDGPLHTVALAEYYLAATSPKVELPQIEAWLAKGQSLPQAEQMARLGLTRGSSAMPRLPRQNRFVAQAPVPKRVRPAPTNDGTMPDSVQQEILDRISNDDPAGAHRLLNGVDASLSPEARAEWRQRVAWSYYIENMDEQALAMAQTVNAGRGAWVAEGEWVAGLAAWRMNDCETAAPAFERAAHGAQNTELRSAGYYWASRAALRCRQPERSSAMLRAAAREDETLYGMLAAEQLGSRLPDHFGQADLSDADWRRLRQIPNVRAAVALAEIGRGELAGEILVHQAKIGDPGEYGALSRLARELGLASTQLYMASYAPAGGTPDPASRYPTPKWAPVTGWQVDPALAFAHALQESNFRTTAVSPAEARGLMQITPITVRQHAPALNLNASAVDLDDPQVNLAFGQQNLEMLRGSPATQGALPKIMAAYNAGLAPVTRWNSEVNDGGDPLLYMESIPYWETRGYVAIVMRNYWMYERQANAESPSRLSLAQNAWPVFPGSQQQNGRVHLAAGSD